MATDRLAALLHSTTDAQTWALEFVRIYPANTPDMDTLIGWFANAIETGRAAGVGFVGAARPVPCPLCPHHMHLHDQEGRCGGGCH